MSQMTSETPPVYDVTIVCTTDDFQVGVLCIVVDGDRPNIIDWKELDGRWIDVMLLDVTPKQSCIINC